MGCVASKLEEEEEVVSICRERKNQLKLAVERRYALAEAHWRYSQSLYAVSAAIKLFVARHSSPSSPFLITFPSSSTTSSDDPKTQNQNQNQSQNQNQHQNLITNPMFLHQVPAESGCGAIERGGAGGSCGSSTNTISSEDDDNENGVDDDDDEDEEVVQREQVEERVERHEHVQQPCGYFYMQMPTLIPSPQRDFGWDFFNPFESVNRPEIISGYRRNSDEEELRVVREEEGIPELEEEDHHEISHNTGAVAGGEETGVKREKRVSEAIVKREVSKDVVDESVVGVKNQSDQKGLQVIDTPSEGRELLEALKDIEDYFIKACDSGKDVSRMLEANLIQMQSGLEEIKENSTKLIQSIAWHRTISSKPSSCKSLVASSSKSSSTWTEFNNDLFDDYGGMSSGSHSFTLGRIYAWEKKLYEEVKAGDITRKLYEKKCSRLRNQDVKGEDELSMDKTRAAVKDLYARILVAIRSAESISRRIEKLRDEELQPQIIELLKGLMLSWKIMLEAHETQNKVLFEVKTFASPGFGKFCNDSHRLATIQLKAELQNWRARFADYILAQKAYVEALHGWLAKFIVPEVEFYSRARGGSAPLTSRVKGPPLLTICHDWLYSMEKLPQKSVAFALKSFERDIKALCQQQEEEQQQKRRVDGLAKDLDRRIIAFQRTESRFLDSKLMIEHGDSDFDRRSESSVSEKKDQLESSRMRLDMEREKHQSCMKETQRMTLTGFQTGFCSVFESLIEFSKASQNMYNELVTHSERAENVSYIEDSTTKVEENNSR